MYFRQLATCAALVTVIAGARCSLYAQTSGSASINFNNFYGPAGNVSGTAYTPGKNLSGRYSCTIPNNGSTNVTTQDGTIVFPYSFNTTGQGSQSYPVSFTPNLVNGSFSGSLTYTCTGSGEPNATFVISAQGDSIVAVSQAAPKYQVLSILYTPPGNASSTGFSNSTSAGATTSIANNFSTSDAITFKAGIFGASNSVTFTVGASTTLTNGYGVTYQATSSSQLSAVKQAIDHTQDQVYLWINPTVTVYQTGSASGYFNMGTIDNSGNFNSGAPMDIVNVNIAGLENPSLIPLDILEPQTPEPGVTIPGLASVCAHPLPVSQCTQQNACGCVPSDFSAAVAQDELAAITNQTEAPSSVDSNRYVYLTYQTLEGPEQQGAGPVKNGFSISDSTMSSSSFGQGESYGVGFTHTFSTPGGDATPSLGVSTSNSFTYSHSETSGTSGGTSHTGTLTLGTSDVGCSEYVDIYEDTVYHTFAYSLPTAPPQNCL